MASFVRVCVALLCVGADTRENDVVFAEVKQIDFKTTQPKTWCGFRDLDGVSSAEPLLIKSAEKFSFHWDSVLPEDEIVSVELSNSFTFKPYANLHQTSLPVTWAVAKKILKGEHPVSRTFASYIHQQSLLSPLDPFLSEIARHLPQCFSEIVAHKVLFWLGGSTNHTSGLHYDAVDNLYVMLEGSKEVLSKQIIICFFFWYLRFLPVLNFWHTHTKKYIYTHSCTHIILVLSNQPPR